MRTMYKPFLLTVFALLISLQNPQVSFSQGGEADICSGDCMIVWSDEYAPDISDVYFDKVYAGIETDEEYHSHRCDY